MKKTNSALTSAGVAVCLSLLVGIPVSAGTGMDVGDHNPREILERVDRMMTADSTAGIMVMTIRTTHWTRTLTVRFWTKGRDRLLMRILSPRKERDTATLRSGSDIWNYLPKTDRIIRVPPASLASSWMGSHFAYDDLLSENRFADQYTFEIAGEWETPAGLFVEISCTPKSDLPIVWGRVHVVVNRKDDLPVAIRYYDEAGALVRTLEFLDVGPLGGRGIPRRQRMTPADRPGEFTELSYEDLAFDPVLDDAMFSFRGLKK